MKEIMWITEEMEILGNNMLSIIYPTSDDKDAYTDEEAEMLDKMHKEKIKLSDPILVVDVEGYIGSSTRSEIEFAMTLGKEIIYYSELIKTMPSYEIAKNQGFARTRSLI